MLAPTFTSPVTTSLTPVAISTAALPTVAICSASLSSPVSLIACANSETSFPASLIWASRLAASPMNFLSSASASLSRSARSTRFCSSSVLVSSVPAAVAPLAFAKPPSTALTIPALSIAEPSFFSSTPVVSFSLTGSPGTSTWLEIVCPSTTVLTVFASPATKPVALIWAGVASNPTPIHCLKVSLAALRQSGFFSAQSSRARAAGSRAGSLRPSFRLCALLSGVPRAMPSPTCATARR